MTQMLARDLFTVVNLLVFKYAINADIRSMNEENNACAIALEHRTWLHSKLTSINC